MGQEDIIKPFISGGSSPRAMVGEIIFGRKTASDKAPQGRHAHWHGRGDCSQRHPDQPAAPRAEPGGDHTAGVLWGPPPSLPSSKVKAFPAD